MPEMKKVIQLPCDPDELRLLNHCLVYSIACQSGSVHVAFSSHASIGKIMDYMGQDKVNALVDLILRLGTAAEPDRPVVDMDKEH